MLKTFQENITVFINNRIDGLFMKKAKEIFIMYLKEKYPSRIVINATIEASFL
jgi:hypothetical protein